jgi:sulfite reductase alpha subunit-like flavoprotein
MKVYVYASLILEVRLKLFTGEPADNAGHFVSWLTNLKGKELEGVKYSGNSESDSKCQLYSLD